MNLGFSLLSSQDQMSIASRGGYRLDYRALGVQHEPLDQTNLSNDLDASSKAVGNRHRKLVDRWAYQGSGGPTCQPLGLRFGDVASRYF